MRKQTFVALYFVGFLLPCVFGGCSKRHPLETHPVRGIVRFPDNKVVRNGSVEFEIIGMKSAVTARGKIRPDGSFVLGTFEREDGAVAGKHRVIVISKFLIGNGAERPGLIPEATLDSKYSQYRTSGIEVEVKPGSNNLIIDVDYTSALKKQKENEVKAQAVEPTTPDNEKND